MKIFCDNGDCDYISEYGFCDCDKLSIVGGVCEGSYKSGRNACDGDVDVRLKAENERLRVLVREVVEFHATEHADMEVLRFYSDKDHGVYRRMQELGIEEGA